MTDPETQKTIDTYLAALRKQLRELMEEDATDIVEEIRAHIFDKTSSGGSPEKVSATLAALGTPEASSAGASSPRTCCRRRWRGTHAFAAGQPAQPAALGHSQLHGHCGIHRLRIRLCLGGRTRHLRRAQSGLPARQWIVEDRLSRRHMGTQSVRSRAERPRRARNSSDGGCCPLDCFSARGCCSSPSALEPGAFANSGARVQRNSPTARQVCLLLVGSSSVQQRKSPPLALRARGPEALRPIAAAIMKW